MAEDEVVLQEPRPWVPQDEAPDSAAPDGDVPAQPSSSASGGDAGGDGGQGGEEPEPLPEFDPKWRQDFQGLMYLGKLTREFRLYGHRFVIRTMTVDEVLEVGMLAYPYAGTMSEGKAYQAAVVAGCIVSVDGQPPPIPITNGSKDTMMRNAFDWIRREWFPPTLDGIYERYLRLEKDVGDMLVALGESSG